MWFDGPSFLRTSHCFEPQPVDFPVPDEQSESSVTCGTFAAAAVEQGDGLSKLISHYSKWSALKKAIAIYQRLCRILRERVMNRSMPTGSDWMSSPFTVKEMEDAEACVIRYTQMQFFQDDLMRLQGVGKGRKCTPLLSLDPFLDSDGLLRVGGRLKASNLVEREKHPLVLPRSCHVTSLVIRDVHERLAHAGRNYVLSTLRERFWVVAGNAAVRGIISKCVTCRRFRGQMCDQKMADLPACRTTSEAPFTYTGTDLFGPFHVKEGRKVLKRYGVIFTCFSSRAIHLEMVNNLDTDSFLNALRRFLARRGPVHTMYSDNGTNFVGAERELRAAMNEMDQDRIHRYLLDSNIQWSFNPPAASHFGGVWERQIRTVRNVLTTTLQQCDRLDDDVCRTVLCEAESIVNSRPITTVSTDVNDLDPLSPNQILTLKTKVLLPPPGEFQRTDVYMRKRWRRAQYLANLFWSRWKREFLVTLQARSKWSASKRNLQIGDIVIVKDECLHRNEWLLGRVVDVVADDNGLVRQCSVKTQKSTLRRPVHKLVLLIEANE